MPFKTIKSASDAETTIKRSRFIGSLRRASCHTEVESAIRDVALLYEKATHYCWAYRLAGETIVEHASDAGEPSGSAGRPILGTLKRHELLNVVAVVTRYYGGVKLGVRGLITAYSEAAELAIASAETMMDEPRTTLVFNITYDSYNLLVQILNRAGVDSASIEASFAARVEGSASVPCSAVDQLNLELSDLSGTDRLTYSYT